MILILLRFILNKEELLADTFDLETLFVNNINIQNDWSLKNYYAQDSV